MKMKMTPRIEILKEKKLVGFRQAMSIKENMTAGLWKRFMPLRHEILNRVSNEFISMAVYAPAYFSRFDPENSFEKWAVVEVSDYGSMPVQMETVTLPGGLYAVFHYKGYAGDAGIFHHIFGNWLPASDYMLDDRPHFEILGDNYRNYDPDSEEEICIPVRPKYQSK